MDFVYVARPTAQTMGREGFAGCRGSYLSCGLTRRGGTPIALGADELLRANIRKAIDTGEA